MELSCVNQRDVNSSQVIFVLVSRKGWVVFTLYMGMTCAPDV